MKYDYELVSGNVNQVDYNEGRGDQFHQRYVYDADNALTEVQTSRDGTIRESDAGYFDGDFTRSGSAPQTTSQSFLGIFQLRIGIENTFSFFTGYV